MTHDDDDQPANGLPEYIGMALLIIGAIILFIFWMNVAALERW